MKRALWGRLVAVVVGVGVLVAGYLYFSRAGQPATGANAPLAKDSTQKKKARAVPVMVANATVRSVPVKLEAIGTVQSPSTVQVRSRVDGQLVAALFREGQSVKTGDLLFRIDRRPFQAQLNQAEAILARDQAQYDKAKADLARYSRLSESGFSSQQKLEEAKAATATLQAVIRADMAAVESARLQLEFTEIRAPIDGRTGSILITPGNLVKANDSPALVVINETQPIHIAFSVPEQNLTTIKSRLSTGTLPVTVTIAEQAATRIIGEVSFVNNAVDIDTGTIQLKAVFANEDNLLTPGQFVRVALILDTLTDAVVVPTGAIQDGQKGSFVFVVGDDKKAVPRNVGIGPEIDQMTVVRNGLSAGETVVTAGQLRLFPGAPVEVKKEGAAAGEGKTSTSKSEKKDGKKKGRAP